MIKFNCIFVMLFTLTTLISFQACKKEDPKPEVDQEEFNRAVISFTKLDANGNPTAIVVNAQFDDFEHDHEPDAGGTEDTHTAIDLETGVKYRMEVKLFVDQELINSEIMDEADLHQFFFLPSVSGAMTYQYEDRDKNNKPVGLSGLIEFTAAGELELNIVLRHNLEKDHAAAANWNSANHADAGGAEDLNISLDIHADN
jgi:hypothetical protein